MPLDPAQAHLPTLTDPDSVIDFMCLCAMGILSNAMDPRTYKWSAGSDDTDHEFNRMHDINAMPHEDRVQYVYIRGLCYHLLDWFFATYNINFKNGMPLGNPRKEVFLEPFADVISVLFKGASLLDDHHPEIPADDSRSNSYCACKRMRP